MTDSETDHPLRLAAFVAQALDLTDDPATLAGEIHALKRDVNAGISTLELDSSVGPAAFLLYDYALTAAGEDGRTGRDLFTADLATLERAAEHQTPGPRIMAHATAGDHAFILATTPATYQLLTGDDAAEPIEVSEADLPPGAATIETRRAAADDLLRLLKAANDRAAEWLRAVQPERRNARETGDGLAFTGEETALALFLLDDRSISDLLRLINEFLNSARDHAATFRGNDGR